MPHLEVFGTNVNKHKQSLLRRTSAKMPAKKVTGLPDYME
jgi:hypothetical protein